MAEIKQENTIALDSGKQPSPAAAPSAAPPKASKGEKVFDWAVYKGLNFWVNLASSIAISDYAIHGGGRQKLDSVIRRAAKGVDAAGLMKGTTAYKQSKVLIETATLLSGGWLLLVPMKMMEDNKRSMVHWLDKKFGTAELDADGKEVAIEQIHLEHDQPKQSWGKVLGRRLLATGAVMGSGSLLEHLAKHPTEVKELKYRFNDVHYREIVPVGGKERVTNVVVDRLNKVGNAIVGENKFGNDPNSLKQRWLNFTVLDSVFTAMTAGIMYVTNGSQKVEHGAKDGSTETKPAPAPKATTEEASKGNFASRIEPQKRKAQKSEEDVTYAQRVASSQEAAMQQGL